MLYHIFKVKMGLGFHFGSQTDKRSVGFESQSILLLDTVKQLQEGIVLSKYTPSHVWNQLSTSSRTCTEV